MPVDILFLGTGAGRPAKTRNVTAIVLQLHKERGAFWLFDAGEATQHQCMRAHVKLSKCEKIFITHLHGDHIFGLPGLISSRSADGATDRLTVYGPSGIKSFLQSTFDVSQTYLLFPLDIVEITQDGPIFEDDQFLVTARKLNHPITSYGYRIAQKARPGKVHSDKLAEAGIQPGPIYGQLQKGENVMLADGTILHSSDFVGPPRKGRILTILGDTLPSKSAIDLGRHADVIVHESTFMPEHRTLAQQYGHSTTIDAATVAREARADALIVTHVSSRYADLTDDMFLWQAREIFNNVHLAHDFSCFSIPLDPH